MAKESDTLFKNVLEPLRVINTDPRKDKVKASANLKFSDSNQPLKEGATPKICLGEPSSSPIFTQSGTSGKCSDTKSKLKKLQTRMKLQNRSIEENERACDKVKEYLMKQHEKDERAISDVKKQLRLARRREQALKDEYALMIKEHYESKLKWEKDRNELQKQIVELKDKLVKSNVTSKDKLLSEIKEDMAELSEEWATLKFERDEATAKLNDLLIVRKYEDTLIDTCSLFMEQLQERLQLASEERDSYRISNNMYAEPSDEYLTLR